jgi:RNA-directed DNA polymerase
LKRKTPISLAEIAKRINPVVRGWVVYYGRFYRSALSRVMKQVDLHLAKWIARKHKRVHGSLAQAFDWLRRIRRSVPGLFAHWDLDYQS